MGGGFVRKLVCCGSSSFPSEREVGEGKIRVYVGKEREMACKLEMEANYLNHPLFEDLLRLSEEEFGYSYDGALRIACEIELFQYLLHLLNNSNPSAHYMQLPDLIANFHSTTTATATQPTHTTTQPLPHPQ